MAPSVHDNEIPFIQHTGRYMAGDLRRSSVFEFEELLLKAAVEGPPAGWSRIPTSEKCWVLIRTHCCF